MKNIIVTTAYPAAELYIQEFAESLNEQTDSNFEIYLFNQQLENIDEYVSYFTAKVKIIDIPKQPSVIKVKDFMYNYLKKEEGIATIIFADIDDYFDNRRVELVLKHLKKYDVVVNDLTLVDDSHNILEERILSKRFDSGYEVRFEDIADKNFIGLSNIGFKAEYIQDILPINDILVTDWWVSSSLLSKNRTCCFISDTVTYYRQYLDNWVGMKQKFSKGDIEYSIKVKKHHYKNLLKYITGEKHELITEKFDEVLKVEHKLLSEKNMNNYLDKINKLAKTQKFLWWENIAASII